QAAGTTAQMIEQSRTNADQGVAASAEVATILGQINTDVAKMVTIVEELAEAGRSQASGIGQVNTAVTQIDSVTQASAASAEQAAAASTELYNQVSELSTVVDGLAHLVGGEFARSAGAPRHANDARKIERPSGERRALARAGGAKTGRGVSVIRPDKAIPLDDADF
ncbi:MAG: hypothetical protein FJY92_07155, partial [Candidatus Hydrogenedentes bacterium]|nr:hypothetical protein [Candidatus Hydrogenedentota bacterium]